MEDDDDATAGRSLVTEYYDALDAGDYDALRGVLAPGFVQRRPDRSFESREAFVRFMRDDRPRTDTVHAVDAVYGATPETDVGRDRPGDREGDGASGVAAAPASAPSSAPDSDLDPGPGPGPGPGSDPDDRSPPDSTGEVAVRGRLLGEDDRTELVAFVDVFRVVDGRLAELRTYTG